METYIPYPDFEESADALGISERVASIDGVIRILDALHEITHDASMEAMILRHPTAKMWGEHTPVMIQYALVLNSRLTGEQAPHYEETLTQHLDWATAGGYTLDAPRWIGEQSFHVGQKAALIRLRPIVYGYLWPEIDPSTPQIWPGA